MGKEGSDWVADQRAIEGRQTRVAELMLHQRTQIEIADLLGVDDSTIARDMRAVRAEWARKRRASGDAWVAERIAELNALRRAYGPAAVNGDLKAAEFLLKVGAQLNDLLGLDAGFRSRRRRRYPHSDAGAFTFGRLLGATLRSPAVQVGLGL